MVRDETGALRAQMVMPTAEELGKLRAPMRQGTSPYATGERDPSMIPADLARTTGALAKGAVSGAVGAPGDIAGLAYGIGRSLAAEEGERLDAFVSGVEEMSAKYGAQAVSDILGNVGGLVGLSLAPEGDERAQAMTRQAQLAGEVVGLPKGLQLAARAARDVARRQSGAASELGAIGPEIQAKIDPRKTIAMQPREVIEALDDETRGIIRDLATEKRAAETVAPGLDDTQIITGDELLRALSKAQKKIPTRKQDELGFYSRAQEFIDNLKQEKLSGPQLKGQMLNAGVKADELKWTGLDEFLEANPKLTKQEAMDFIEQNKVKLEEITYEGGTLNPDTYQNFSQPQVIDDYDEINHQREIINDDLGDAMTVSVLEDMNLVEQGDEKRFIEGFRTFLANGFSDELRRDYPDIDPQDFVAYDQKLEDIASERYYDNPLYESYGEGALDDYRIVGNEDTGFYPTYKGASFTDDYIGSLNEAQVRIQDDAVDRGLVEVGDGTQYSEYTQEGAENYREVLLTNPGYKGDPSFKFSDEKKARLQELRQKDRQAILSDLDDEPSATLTDAEKKEMRRLKRQEEELGRLAGRSYDSPHWQEDDVVAHARLSDREARDSFTHSSGARADGKVLYIEELQSDWAQAGRRRGFGMLEPGSYSVKKNDIRRRTNRETGYTEPIDGYIVVDQDGKLVEQGIREGATSGVFESLEAAKERAEELSGTMRAGLPEGPLVGSTDKWTEATMRRLIRKAADEGYDYIAWTPGFIQRGRWGEEGLVPFYDKMLPKATEKVAKKLDKEAKVETIEIQIVPPSVGEPQSTKALRITDKLKTMAKEGQPLFAVPAAVGVGAALKPKEETDGNL